MIVIERFVYSKFEVNNYIVNLTSIIDFNSIYWVIVSTKTNTLECVDQVNALEFLLFTERSFLFWNVQLLCLLYDVLICWNLNSFCSLNDGLMYLWVSEPPKHNATRVSSLLVCATLLFTETIFMCWNGPFFCLLKQLFMFWNLQFFCLLNDVLMCWNVQFFFLNDICVGMKSFVFLF